MHVMQLRVLSAIIASVVVAGNIAWAAGASKRTDYSLPYRLCLHQAAQSYGLHPRLLKAIVRVENGQWNPFSVNINRQGQGYPQTVRSYPEAVQLVTKLWTQNVNFDVGLGMVNTINMERFKIHPIALLDPCTNLRYSARILRESIDRHGYNWTAIERYNGHNPQYPWKIHQALKEIPQ